MKLSVGTRDWFGYRFQLSDVGAYTYGNAAHPHAVTAAGSWTIGYDANGNMNARAGGAISSYSYNLPNQINYNGSSSQFNYDSNHQRWKQVAMYGTTTETVHYIGGLLQVVTRGTNPTEYRHQIPAGSSTAVYTRRSDGTIGTYYATSDHLGSADLVMDNAANVLVRESFTSFGARRGSNWQSTPTTQDYNAIQSATRQGFTGHEMLDSVGLIHMNGRVYDPTLGKFMSADTVIQSLGATQSINPYSYAWNAPLRYIDPSGHSLLGQIIGLIVTIAIIVWAPELGLPALNAAGGAGAMTALVAGFVGGFVGALVSTGSLDAAFTAGLISGLTALAFYGAGFVGSSSGSPWEVTENVLAHAAVGCASAVASGGNCGKGALSAAIADAASPYIVQFPSLAQWSSAPEAAEAGLIGGVAAKIEGGKFTDGFSVAAAGYLFNIWAHNGQDPNTRHTIGVQKWVAIFSAPGSGYTVLGTEMTASNWDVPFQRVYDIVLQDESGNIIGVEVKTTVVGLFRLNSRQVAFDVMTVAGGSTLDATGLPINSVMYRGVDFLSNLATAWQGGELLSALNGSKIPFHWIGGSLPMKPGQ